MREEIIGENLILRKVEKGDSKHIARWFSDKDNIKHMSSFVRANEHSPEKIMHEIEDSDPKFERLFMVYTKNNELVGHCGIDDLDLYDQRGEVFFLIGEKEHKGKGYGIEITKMLLEIAFEEMNLNSLFASATVENFPSIKVLEKCGFKKIGIRREYNYIDGEFMDEIFFDLTKKEYFSSKF